MCEQQSSVQRYRTAITLLAALHYTEVAELVHRTGSVAAAAAVAAVHGNAHSLMLLP
jgi:hypothetical protein